MKLYANSETYHLSILQNDPGLPWLLFFHGFMGSSDLFEPLANRLTGSCNPVVIDLLGHGKTSGSAAPGRFSAEKQVADLHSILDRLQLQNLFLYGYSMGGRLAQTLLVSDPSRFSGIILESTHCGIRDEAERKERAQIDEKRAKEVESDFQGFLDLWTDLPLFESPAGSSDFSYEMVMRGQKPDLMAASLRGFGAGKMLPVCDQIIDAAVPVGLIAGQSDQKYVDKMNEMAQLWSHSELSVIENAGHRVHADRPDQTAKLITQFLHKHV